MGENNTNMCRMCLESNSTLDIFLTMAHGDLVANLLIDLGDIEVSLDDPDPMPRFICDTCYNNLITAYVTRKQIRDSDNLLRDIYASRKNEADYDVTDQSTNRQELTLCIEHIKEEDPSANVDFKLSEDEMAEWVMFPQQMTEAVAEPEPITMTHHCCMCPETFEDFEVLKQHAFDVHNKQWQPIENTKRKGFLKNAAQCDLCGRKYDTQYLLRKHKGMYKVMVTCDVCGTMMQRHAMGAHLKWHKGEEIECDICHKMYKKVYIREHKTKVHCVEKQFKCDHCPKEFPIKHLLKRHMQRHDPNFKRPVLATCTVCNREFESKSAMRNHMFIHSGQKRYACEHCSTSFVHRTDYLRHLWTHTGSPYSCSKCNKYMDRPSHLKAHQTAGCGNQVYNVRRRTKNESSKIAARVIKLHVSSSSSSESEDSDVDETSSIQTESIGIMPYNCGECTETFMSESDFAMHMAMHTQTM